MVRNATLALAITLGSTLPAVAQTSSGASPIATQLYSESHITTIMPRHVTTFAESPVATPLAAAPRLDLSGPAVRAALAVEQTPEATAQEIESKRTTGLVKILIGAGAALTGVSWMAVGGSAVSVGATEAGSTHLIIGAALAGGGGYLIYDGMGDRADAAALAAGANPSANLAFIPLPRGSAVGFQPLPRGAAVGFRKAW